MARRMRAPAAALLSVSRPATTSSILVSTLLLLGHLCTGVNSRADGKDASGLPPISLGFTTTGEAVQGHQEVGDMTAPVLSQKSLAEATTAQKGWTALTMTLDDGAKTKTIMLRDGATEQEVRAAVEKGCREAGVKDDYQASTVTAKWMTAQLGYKRTQWWFERSGAKKSFQTFFGGMAAVAEERPFYALEMGSLEAASALWLTDNLLKHPDSVLVCLDTWDGGPDLEHFDIDMPTVEERFKWNIAKAPNGERVVALKGDSLRSLAVLVARGLSSSFDAIYVDASHKMKDVMADALLSFRLLKVGGVMIFDDYSLYAGVEQAMTPLEEALGDSLEVLFRQDILVVKKLADDRWATPESVLIAGDLARLDGMASGGAVYSDDSKVAYGSANA